MKINTKNNATIVENIIIFHKEQIVRLMEKLALFVKN